MERNTPTTPRSSDLENTEILSSEIYSEIQRGNLIQPTFFGDQSLTQNFNDFLLGVKSTNRYSGWAKTLPENGEEDEYYLSENEKSEIKKMAKSMTNYGNIDYDTALDFLYILVSVDKIEYLENISIAVNLPDLNNPDILRKPLLILSIKNLEKVAYIASAIAAIIKKFSRFIRAANSPRTKSDPFEIIQKVLGALNFSSNSNLAQTLLEQDNVENRLGNFLSELVTGTRIPMPIIAKNPMNESPSYTGMTFFGESAHPMSLVDMNEIFPKKIAAFPRFENGAGTTSFKFQNFQSLQGDMEINNVVNLLMTGSETIPSTNLALLNKATAAQSQVQSIMGANSTDTIRLNKAEDSIPLMIAMSSINTNTDEPIIPNNVFEDGWIMANSLNSFLQSEQNDYLTALRTLT